MRYRKLIIGAVSAMLMFMLFVTPIQSSQTTKPAAIAAQVPESAAHWYHYLGLWWDDRTPGVLCDGTPGFSYENVPAYGTITVNETDFDDSQCMMFNKTNTGLSMDAKFTRTLTGYWRLTFKLASNATNTDIGMWFVNGSTLLFGAGFDTGKIFVWDGATVQYDDYVVDTWYDFDMRCSTVNDTYQVFVDGELIEGNALNPAAGDVSQITGYWYREPSATLGVAWSDDFQLWGYATYTYTTDELIYEFIDALDYVYDNMYQPGATGLLNGTSIITGYEYETNMSYPRITKGYVMDAAIRAYEITLLAKYYNMAVDIGRWLVYVSQDDDGYFPFVGGTVPNFENNLLTSMEIAASLLRLYELTGNTVYYNSAIEAIEYHLDNTWNATLGLFNDAPDTEYCRVNFNTAAARDLAYAYYVTGDADYGMRAAAILTNLLPYAQVGDPTEYDPDENFSGRTYYALDITYSAWQNWSYESWTANGYAMATYYLSLAGGYDSYISAWVDALHKQMANVFLNSAPYGMAYNVGTHNYLESLVALGYYNLVANDTIPMFRDGFYSMVEYCTDRATVTLSDHAFIPGALYEVDPDYVLGACTAIGQALTIWDFEELGNFTQPYRLSLNSTARLLLTPTSDSITVDDVSQDGDIFEFSITTVLPGELVSYSILNLDNGYGYRVYQGTDIIHTGLGGTLLFTAYGNGDFTVEVWNTRQVSTLLILAVNLVAVGIVVSVLSGMVVPIVNDIKQKKQVKPDRLIRDAIKSVVFIVVGLSMWVLLRTVAIG